MGLGEKKPATKAGLNPYQRRRHGGDRAKYRGALVIDPIFILYIGYMFCE